MLTLVENSFMTLNPDQITVGSNLVQYVYEYIGYSIANTVNIQHWRPDPKNSLYTSRTIHCNVHFTCIHVYIADNPIPRTVYVHCDNPIPRTVYIHRRQSNPMCSLCISQTIQSHEEFYIHRGQSNPKNNLYTSRTIQSQEQFIYIADYPKSCTVYIDRGHSNPKNSL